MAAPDKKRLIGNESLQTRTRFIILYKFLLIGFNYWDKNSHSPPYVQTATYHFVNDYYCFIFVDIFRSAIYNIAA